MALGSDPSGLQISGEFGDSTRNTGLTNYDLQWMYNHIIGSGDHSRTAFSGYGQNSASVIDVSTSSTLGGYLDVNINISTNVVINSSIPCKMQLQYQEGDGSIPEGDWITHPTTYTYNSGGNKSIEFEAPEEDTSYHIRMRYWNLFNEHSSDHNYTNFETGQSSSPEKFVTPSILFAEFGTNNNVEVDWNYDSSPSSFSAQYRSDSVSWTQMSLIQAIRWGSTDNPKRGIWDNPEIIPSANAEVRIRADAEGDVSASNWSDPFPLN